MGKTQKKSTVFSQPWRPHAAPAWTGRPGTHSANARCPPRPTSPTAQLIKTPLRAERTRPANLTPTARTFWRARRRTPIASLAVMLSPRSARKRWRSIYSVQLRFRSDRAVFNVQISAQNGATTQCESQRRDIESICCSEQVLLQPRCQHGSVAQILGD